MNNLPSSPTMSLELMQKMFKELYIYSRLLRKSQVEYFASKNHSDLIRAKSYETLYDLKLKMLFTMVKGHDVEMAEDIEQKIQDKWNFRSLKQVDLFKD